MSDGIVFLVDVDNTLLDNDQVQRDLDRHLEAVLGDERRQLYWSILADLSAEVGYRDYLGALQRLRARHPEEIDVLAVSPWLIDYPFADRLFPGALEVLAGFARLGTPVILSDGDVVLQPRKIARSGIAAAIAGNILIYIHKEQMLAEVERRYPARHYVLVDDKPRILAAVKRIWGDNVTTVFPRQGHYATDAKALAESDPPDVTVERIGDLVGHDFVERFR